VEHGAEHTDPDQPPSQAPSTAAARPRRGDIARRWRDWRERRKLAAPVSPRSRRTLARQLRRTAEDVRNPRSRGPTHRLVLHYRVAAVRSDLLEIAALLEHAHDPDPECLTALRDLLRDAASPLYDPAVDPAQLSATLDHARAGLQRQRP
jgi:hypothetical protein